VAHNLLPPFQLALDTFGQQIVKNIVIDFEAWLETLKVEVLPIAPGDGTAVMQAYFAGKPPFRKVRHRDDMPDAFILQALGGFGTRVGSFHAVVDDTRLREAVGALPNAHVYDTLDGFIGADTVQAALKRATGAANFSALLAVLRTNSHVLDKAMEAQYIDRLHGETISSRGIPDDNNEARISGVWEISDQRYDWENAEYYGEGRIGIPFTFETRVDAVSALFKSDYYAMSDEASAAISISELNEHYFEVEGQYGILVMGLVVVDVPSDLAATTLALDALPSLVEAATVRIDKVDDVVVVDPDG